MFKTNTLKSKMFVGEDIWKIWLYITNKIFCNICKTHTDCDLFEMQSLNIFKKLINTYISGYCS